MMMVCVASAGPAGDALPIAVRLPGTHFAILKPVAKSPGAQGEVPRETSLRKISTNGL